MATPLQPLAKCVLNYLYNLTSEQLEALKAMIESMILLIDAYLLQLRAQAAASSYEKVVTELIWLPAEEAINFAKSQLVNPLSDEAQLCPQLYQYLTDPIVGLTESTLNALLPYKDKYAKLLSATAAIDLLIQYWENIKGQLQLMLELIDDVIYWKLQQLGNIVP